MYLKKKLSYVVMLLLMVFTLAYAGGTVHASAASSAKWETSGGKIRYKKANGQYAKNVFKKISGKYFYFDEEGYVVTGFQTIGGKLFYFKKTGKAGTKGKVLTGWRTFGGKKYYFRTTGAKGTIGAAYQSEWATIDGQRYYFNSDGSLNTNTMTETEFIETVGNLAREDMKQSGILASVTTAQAILESGYGTTSLGMEANNLFGMKASLSANTWSSPWTGKIFIKSTQEYLDETWYTITDTFRAYDSYAQSVADHSAYLAGAMDGTKLRYAGVVGNTSYKKTIKLIKKGGYATDPDYVSKICNIITRYNLTQYDK